MKVNIVTAKPAGGGKPVVLKISEQADEVIDFFGELRAAKGVHPETGEKYVAIALFQRPTTTKRSTFHENEDAASEGQRKTDARAKPAPARLPDPAKESVAAPPSVGSVEEDTGI